MPAEGRNSAHVASDVAGFAWPDLWTVRINAADRSDRKQGALSGPFLLNPHLNLFEFPEIPTAVTHLSFSRHRAVARIAEFTDDIII